VVCRYELRDRSRLTDSDVARLHRPAYELSFDVQNTGDVFGGDVRTHFSLGYTIVDAGTDTPSIHPSTSINSVAAIAASWIHQRRASSKRSTNGQDHTVAV
jgi:hypothetical protein